MATTKSTTTKTARKPKAPAKKKEAAPRARKERKEKEQPVAAPAAVEAAVSQQPAVTLEKPSLPKGKYVFATGRRKTAIANIRLFAGQGDSLVNKKPLGSYFGYSHYRDEVLKPFQLTGLAGDYYFVSNVSGGGAHAQAQAVAHGISIALSAMSSEIRQVLKKNGLLTRDDRKKERKKPGLKRARRAPQWAKR